MTTTSDGSDRVAGLLRWMAAALPADYRTALAALVDEARATGRGLLLTGSLARQDALPGTDIDVRFLGGPTGFRSGLVEGVRVERGDGDEVTAAARLVAQPMHVYAHLDGLILHDPDGGLTRLGLLAAAVSDSYRASRAERDELARDLGFVLDKVRVGLAAGDVLRASFVLATSSWRILEGVWAVNDLPMPPNSSVRPHLRDLGWPVDAPVVVGQLFFADPEQRARTGARLVAELLDLLVEQKPAGQPRPDALG